VLLAALWTASTAVGQAPEPTAARPAPYVEKVEVRVRTILVFATDAKGNPLAAPLTPADLQILENGAAAEILAVEPARPPKSPKAATPSPAAPAEAPAAAPAAETATPQYLYLDTSTLNSRSMKLVADTVAGHLDAVLATGPLEIVVADATPRVLLPATTDAAKIRHALDELGTTVPGKERLLSVRRDALREIRGTQDGATSSVASNTRAHIRSAASQELALLRTSFHRLEAWAAARPDARAGILYYANDGFDVDPIETYRNTVSSQDVALRQEILQLQAEYGGEVSKLLAHVEGTLAGKGLTTIALALGGTSAEFANSAGNMGKKGAGAMRRPLDEAPLFFYTRPAEPLRLIADATGGEVVSTSTRFGTALDHIGGAWLVTFRVRAQPDGRPHPLAVTATRAGITVRASHHLLTGSPQALSLERATRVLEGSEAPADVPVLATLSGIAKASSGATGGMLRIAANFSALSEALGVGEGAIVPLRLSLAVDLGGGEPFTSSEEVDWRPESSSWRYQLPLTWPSEARRIAVVVEEISTGSTGAAVVAIPPAP